MTFLIALSLTLLPSSAHASGWKLARLIERPVARFLLTETAEGRELVDRVLRHLPKPLRHSPGDMAEFSRILEEHFHWQDVAKELRSRVTTAEAELARASRNALKAGGLDAAEFLRAYASREFRIIEAPYLKFATAPEGSLAAVRERFLFESNAPESRSAPLRSLKGALDRIAVRTESLEHLGAEYGALRDEIDRFRRVAVELAVQSRVSSTALRSLRVQANHLRARLSRLVEGRLIPPSGEKDPTQIFLLQRELQTGLAATQTWFVATP